MIICRNCTQTFNNEITEVEDIESCPKCERDEESVYPNDNRKDSAKTLSDASPFVHLL